MLRGILFHAIFLCVFTASLFLCKIAKKKLASSLPIVLLCVLGCAAAETGVLFGSSVLAGMYIEKSIDIAMWIMSAGELLILLAVMIAAVLILRKTGSGKPGMVLYFLYFGAGVPIFFLEYFSFKDFYELMCKWDILSKEEYLKITARFNTYEIAQLIVSAVPVIVLFVLGILDNRREKAAEKKAEG